MKVKFQKLLFTKKLSLLIILLISILFSYYSYLIEDRSTIYNSEILLPKQTDVYNSHLQGLFRDIYALHANDKGNCEISLDDQELGSSSTIIKLTIRIQDSMIETKDNELTNSILKCESIIRMTIVQFIKFHDEVLNFLKNNFAESNSTNLNIYDDGISASYLKEVSEVNKKKFFLKYFLKNLSVEKLNIKLVYAPTKIYEYILNGIITLLILLAVYAGVLIANKEIKKK